MLTFLAQYQDNGGDAAAAGGCFACGCGGIVMLLVWLVMFVGISALLFWKVFEKAGKPGWASIVPIYNAIVLLEIAGKPVWWIVLFFVPVVNFVAGILVTLEIAKRFGKDTGYAVGMILLPIVFYPMLGFGSAQYQGGPPPTQSGL